MKLGINQRTRFSRLSSPGTRLAESFARIIIHGYFHRGEIDPSSCPSDRWTGYAYRSVLRYPVRHAVQTTSTSS